MAMGHSGLSKLVEELLATLQRDREDAQLAVRHASHLQRSQQQQSQARLQQMYDDYQADWRKANGLTETVVPPPKALVSKE